MKDELIVYNRPKSNISEDIRTIRTNLQFTSSEDESQSFLVTSSIPGEGKSFISSNLAVAFAQTGASTIIVDSDLRLGRVHKIFNVSNSKGLSNLLVGNNINKLDSYIKETKIPNLYVISRGMVPPNPSELLNSNNARKLIDTLKDNFDYVIFDGVPINGLPDSLILAGLLDRVVLVASANYTNIDDLNDTKKALEKIDAKIAGVVLNKASQNKRGKYGKYSNYYYYK